MEHRKEVTKRRIRRKSAGLLTAGLVLALLWAAPAVPEGTPEVLPALRSRTTLHSRYDPDREVPEEQMTALLEAAFTMPTGGGQRSLDFFLVTDREVMQAMRGGNPYSQALETAPCVIVIAAAHDRSVYEELEEMDAGLAAGAILAQAAELGLSTCVLSIAPQAERISSVASGLQMPASYRPILMVAAGYPEADALSSASVETWEDSQVHWNVWQGRN